jgi:hypothetical protein
MRLRSLHATDKGNAMLEFAFLLPVLLLIIIILADVCILLDHQIGMIHLGREAANVLSRGAAFQETFAAIADADGSLQLDGPRGQVIFSRVARDNNGQPIIIAQQSVGGLNRASTVGTLPPNAPNAPANVPNGRILHANTSLVVVELFSEQNHFLGNLGISPGQGTIILHSRASF